MAIELHQLRYFVAAAETGQFSMAAAQSHVSQSAITNAVLQLEAALAVRLFDRLPFSGIYRRAAASPATGSASSHKLEQKQLLMKAFGGV